MGETRRDPDRRVVSEQVRQREAPPLSLGHSFCALARASGPGRISLGCPGPPLSRLSRMTLGLPHQGAGKESLGWPCAPELSSLCLGLQYPLAFALSFSRWLCAHPELYRLPVTLSSAGPVVLGDLITEGSLVSGLAVWGSVHGCGLSLGPEGP